MANRKDNPHKPGTQEHKDWEKENLFPSDPIFGTTLIKDDDYKESKDRAHKRMHSVAEVENAKYEKKKKYLDVLDFIENQTKPEYDSVLDKPKEKSGTYLSLSDIVLDPLNWRGLLQTLGDPGTFNFIPSYPRAPTVAFPKHIPEDATQEEFYKAHEYAIKTEYSKQEWESGWVAVRILRRRKIDYLKYDDNPLIASALAPYTQLYFEFYIK